MSVPQRQVLSGTAARVSCLVPDAPHDRLRPGVRLRLFERATQRYATVEILD